jgi:hypothetical protein
MSCTLHGTTSSSRPRIGLQSIKLVHLWFRRGDRRLCASPSEFPPYNKQPDDLPTEVSRSAVRIDDEVLCQPIGSLKHMKGTLLCHELCQLQSYIVYDESLSSGKKRPLVDADVFKERFKPTWTMVFSSHQCSERVSGRKESMTVWLHDCIDRVDLLTWTKHAVSSYRSDIQQNLPLTAVTIATGSTLKRSCWVHTPCAMESSSSTMLTQTCMRAF